MKAPALTASHERFDLNSVVIIGKIQKIRPFNAHHVLVHMASGSNRITLALPEEHDITLLVGEKVNVQGWLEDVPYEESFAAFLQRAGRSSLIEKYAELAPLRVENVTLLVIVLFTVLGSPVVVMTNVRVAVAEIV